VHFMFILDTRVSEVNVDFKNASPESSTQTASRSFKAFLQDSLVCQTGRQTMLFGL